MRKMLFPLMVVLVALSTSCNNAATSDGMTENEQKNLEAVKGIAAAFENNEPNRLDSFIAADVVDHTDMGDKQGLDSVKAMMQMMHSYMTDMKMDAKQRWANGDYVIEWVHYTGNVKEGAPGMPPGPFDMKGMELSRFNNEHKAVEHWFFWDAQTVADMMKQMPGGGMDHMQQMPMQTDTAKSN